MVQTAHRDACARWNVLRGPFGAPQDEVDGCWDAPLTIEDFALPPLDFRENRPVAAISASVDSCSFVIRFTFVLKTSPDLLSKRPEKEGMLGSYNVT